MAKIHFLNVGEGDCTLIQHASGRNTVIDVNKAGTEDQVRKALEAAVPGNFQQKKNPTDPIAYLKKLEINNIFRFILTHPDMDHMGGIKKFFDSFSVWNFWDTDAEKKIDDGDWENSPFDKEDWEFYQSLRKGQVVGVGRKTYYSGARNKYFNDDDLGTGGDSIQVLAPTPELVAKANENGNWNDSSYVFLFEDRGYKFLFAGDSEDHTWEHILKVHPELIANVDVLFAPHHGRDSGRNWDFLDILKPRLVLLGNANSEFLAYDKYRKYGELITNNQAGNILLDTHDGYINVYVSNQMFAAQFSKSYFCSERNAYYIGYLGKLSSGLEKASNALGLTSSLSNPFTDGFTRSRI